MKNKTLYLIFFSFILLGLLCCKTTKKVTTWQIPSDEYAFLEYYQTNEGRALEGNPPPGRRIDGPTYSFNPEAGELQSYLFNSFDKDSLKVIIGRGLVLRGTEGGGLHSRLIPSSKVPFTEEKLTVNSLTSEAISLSWGEKTLQMGAGDVWVEKSSTIDTLYLPEGRVVVENTTTYSIKYFGLLKKENLHLR